MCQPQYCNYSLIYVAAVTVTMDLELQNDGGVRAIKKRPRSKDILINHDAEAFNVG